MKRVLCLALCLAMLMLSCAALAESKAAAPAMAMTDIVIGETTVGDITAASLEIQAFLYTSDGLLTVGFTFSDGPARLTAQASEEQIAKLDELSKTEIDIDKIEEHRVLEDAIFDTFIIESVEDLSGGVISAEELAALVGKNVQELLDDGFAEDQIWFDDTTDEAVFELVANGFYRYVFRSDCDEEAFEALYGEDEMYTLAIRSAGFAGITADAAGSTDLGSMFESTAEIMSNENFLDIIKEGIADGSVGDADLSLLLDFMMSMLPEGIDLGDIQGLSAIEILERVMRNIPEDFDLFGGAELVEAD